MLGKYIAGFSRIVCRITICENRSPAMVSWFFLEMCRESQIICGSVKVGKPCKCTAVFSSNRAHTLSNSATNEGCTEPS